MYVCNHNRRKYGLIVQTVPTLPRQIGLEHGMDFQM